MVGAQGFHFQALEPLRKRFAEQARIPFDGFETVQQAQEVTSLFCVEWQTTQPSSRADPNTRDAKEMRFATRCDQALRKRFEPESIGDARQSAP